VYEERLETMVPGHLKEGKELVEGGGSLAFPAQEDGVEQKDLMDAMELSVIPLLTEAKEPTATRVFLVLEGIKDVSERREGPEETEVLEVMGGTDWTGFREHAAPREIMESEVAKDRRVWRACQACMACLASTA